MSEHPLFEAEQFRVLLEAREVKVHNRNYFWITFDIKFLFISVVKLQNILANFTNQMFNVEILAIHISPEQNKIEVLIRIYESSPAIAQL